MPTQLVGGPRSTLITGGAAGVLPRAFGADPGQQVATRERSRTAFARRELLVQQATGGSAATTMSVTMPMVPTPGNYMIGLGTDPGVAAVWPLPSTTGASWARIDDHGNAWGLFVFDGVVRSGMAAAITVTADNANNHAVHISEWSGTAGYVLQSIASNATSASIVTSSITAQAHDSLLIAAFDTAGGATITVGASGGFTDLFAISQGGRIIQVAYKYVSGGSHSTGWTISGSQNYDAIILEIPLLPAPTLAAILVVGDATTLTTMDQHLYQRLLGNGFAVTIVDDGAGEADTTGFDLVVIAASCASATVGTNYAGVAAPVLYIDNGVALNAGLVADVSNVSSTNLADITDAANPGAGGLSGSGVAEWRYFEPVWWSTVANLPAGASVFMTIASQPTEAIAATFESASSLLSGSAANRRAFAYLYDDAYNTTAPYGPMVPSWLHFDGLAAWLAAGVAAPPSAAEYPFIGGGFYGAG